MTICKNKTGYNGLVNICFFSFTFAFSAFSFGGFVDVKSCISIPTDLSSRFSFGLKALGITLAAQALFFLIIALCPIFSTDPNFRKIHYILLILAAAYIFSIYLTVTAFSYSSILHIISLIVSLSTIPISILTLCIYLLGKCVNRDGISLKPYFLSIECYPPAENEPKIPLSSDKNDQKDHSDDLDDDDGYYSDYSCDTMQSFKDDRRCDSLHYCNACDLDQPHSIVISKEKRGKGLNLSDLPALAYLSIFISIFAFIAACVVYFFYSSTSVGSYLANLVDDEKLKMTQSLGFGLLIIGFTLFYQGILFIATFAFSPLRHDTLLKKIYRLLALLPIGYIYGCFLFLSWFYANIYYLTSLTLISSALPTFIILWYISYLDARSSNSEYLTSDELGI